MRRRIGELEIHALDGGLVLETAGRTLIIDAPVGSVNAVHASAIVFTSGRARALAGLWSLLASAERRLLPEPLVVWSALDEPRPMLIVEAWVRGNGEPCPLVLDSDGPGATVDLPPWRIVTAALAGVEPRGREGAPARIPVVGLRIEVGGVAVAYIPAAAPTAAARRLCAGADLAILEVPSASWPGAPVGDPAELAAVAKDAWWLAEGGQPEG